MSNLVISVVCIINVIYCSCIYLFLCGLLIIAFVNNSVFKLTFFDLTIPNNAEK